MKQVKEKKKLSKGKKALIIIACIILSIALAAVIFINVVTRPSLDTGEYHPVGGMVVSESIEYKSDNPAAKSIRHNPVIRLMQMVWRFCEDGDKAKHAVQTPPSDVEKDVDIPYIDDGNVFHKLDVYYPKGKDVRSLPMIVDIHGGGWIYGDKNLNEYYCLELAHKGYVVFNISYRLVPDVTVGEQIQDCFSALDYINKNYKKYTDNSNMLLTGDSAGGMLASYCAATMNSPELQKRFSVQYDANGIQPTALLLTSPAPYMKDGAMAVYTKLLWGGNYKTNGTYDLMNLNEIVEFAELPPTYLITSDGDSIAQDQTLKAAELLKKKGVEAELVNFGNDENGAALPHVFSVLDPFCKSGQEAIDGALAFYQKHMK